MHVKFISIIHQTKLFKCKHKILNEKEQKRINLINTVPLSRDINEANHSIILKIKLAAGRHSPSRPSISS